MDIGKTFDDFDSRAIEQSISARFEQQVGRYPDGIAALSGETRVTYTELDRAANRIANIVLEVLGDGERNGCAFLSRGVLPHSPPYLNSA